MSEFRVGHKVRDKFMGYSKGEYLTIDRIDSLSSEIERIHCMGRQQGETICQYYPPEWLEFVEQPKQEWEIVSFWCNNALFEWDEQKRGHYVKQNDPYTSRTTAYTPQHCKIHSVKRLSDGEVFTVGDWVRDKIGNGLQIKTFEITGSELYVNLYGASRPFWTYRLNDLSKMLQGPLPVYLTPSEIEKLKQLLK